MHNNGKEKKFFNAFPIINDVDYLFNYAGDIQ